MTAAQSGFASAWRACLSLASVFEAWGAVIRQRISHELVCEDAPGSLGMHMHAGHQKIWVVWKAWRRIKQFHAGRMMDTEDENS